MPEWPLLWTIAKNLCSRGIDREMIGLTVSEMVEPVPASDAADFASATGDDNPAYAEPGGPLPPLYIAKLVIPPLKRIWREPGLKLNLLRMVHAGQTVTWHRTVHSGEPLQVEMSLSGVRDTGAGELLEFSGRCLAGGQTAVEGVTGLLVRTPKRRKRRKRPAANPAPERFRIGLPTRQGQQLEYARASGDRNPIHTSEFFARAAGLPRTILHGACVLAMACTALTRETAAGDIDRIAQIGCRFARPAIPGHPLTLVGYADVGFKQLPFAVFDEWGRPVIQNGRFRHR